MGWIKIKKARKNIGCWESDVSWQQDWLWGRLVQDGWGPKTKILLDISRHISDREKHTKGRILHTQFWKFSVHPIPTSSILSLFVGSPNIRTCLLKSTSVKSKRKPLTDFLIIKAFLQVCQMYTNRLRWKPPQFELSWQPIHNAYCAFMLKLRQICIRP